jgi:thiol-disulfide isomerase/thioredoxin
MRLTTARILGVAAVAGLLGLLASLALDGSLVGRLQALSGQAPAPPPGVAVTRIGEPAPSLRLPDLSGRTRTLPDDFAGRPLLVNFWASWCAPCVEEMPELHRFAVRQGGRGVQVVGIALDDRAAVEAFLQRVRVDYPILIERAGPADASVRLGNGKGLLPYSVLIDAQGRLRKQKLGPLERGEIEDWATGQP